MDGEIEIEEEAWIWEAYMKAIADDATKRRN
jgi:hypothetical protein